MIKLLEGKIAQADRKEALRYLGIAKNIVPAEEVEALLTECEAEFLAAIAPRAVCGTFDVAAEGDRLDLGFAKVESRSLAINLAGCSRIALFAATLGAGADRLVLKYGKVSPARAAVMQALGAAVAEQWCDEINGQIKREYGRTKARFSCGFGDLRLSLQREIFAALNVTKRLGITLSDNYFMTPTKSVTAIVGILD